ncbi:MAG TPA: hypothetical protein VF794_26005 [Archangium sp.]|jgi:hypothetical protein|uniref:hypothetical protein n=1 Tax=Archangium sp. TaxID=1872627 RepID=UPI002EDAF6CD
MAKRTRLIEGTWNCTSCDTRNIPARHRNCPNCNNPREETGQESEFEFGEEQSVTDEKALSAAAAGADWFCDYCGASNRGDTPLCRHCRAERSSTSRALSAEPDPDAAPPPEPEFPRAPKSSRRWLYLVLLLPCFGGGLFSFWGSRTHGVTGQVVSTEWTRTVQRESFQRVSQTGWRDGLSTTAPRMPVNGQGERPGVENIRDCTRRQRGTRQVADGTERVCEDKTRRVQCGTEEKCTRQKLGNGYMKEVCDDVPKYCDESYEDCHTRTRYRTEPVYDVSCTYDTYAWTDMGPPARASGNDSAPRWPELRVGAVDRLRHEEKYLVRIEYQDGGVKRHELEPRNESEFLSWKKGQSVSLQVSNLGSVSNVTQGEAAR